MSNMLINNPSTNRPIADLSDFTAEQIREQTKVNNFETPLLPKEPAGPDKNLPLALDLPPTNGVDVTALRGFVGTLSPGAALAALCIKDALAQNEQNQKQVLATTEAICKDINNQADNIQKAALKQMITSIAAATATAVAGTISSLKTLKIDASISPNEFTQAMVPANNWATAGKGMSEVINGVGGYLSAKDQANNKRLDASIENKRAAVEILRNSMQAQRDLVNKSIDFINAMQANMNQTCSKILG